MLSPGDTAVISYPDSTIIETMADLRRRKIHVHSVRDLLADPLTIGEYLARPMIRRSRWLIRAYDEDQGVLRHFYLGTSREFHSPGQLRLALYEPEGDRPYKVLTRGFDETQNDRHLLVKTVSKLCLWADDELQLRVIADDLQVFHPPPTIIRFPG